MAGEGDAALLDDTCLRTHGKVQAAGRPRPCNGSADTAGAVAGTQPGSIPPATAPEVGASNAAC